MEQYLYSFHHEDILKILQSPKKAQIHEFLLDLSQLKENAPIFFRQLTTSTDYRKIANKWIKAIKKVQQEIKDQLMGTSSSQIKQNFSNASTALLDDQASVSI